MQISLDVRGKRCLEESLDFYCQGELMEGDNQYFCEQAGKKVHVLPAVLAFAICLPCLTLLRRVPCHTRSVPVFLPSTVPDGWGNTLAAVFLLLTMVSARAQVSASLRCP